MTDPLSEVIRLLQPRAVFTKGISGAGRWAVRYSDFGRPSFCTVLEGGCRLTVDGHDAIDLEAGDFVLLPTTPGFVMSGTEPAVPHHIDPRTAPAPDGEVRHGLQEGPADVRLMGGYFLFDGTADDLLVSLLPTVIHVRGAERLSILMRLLDDEAAEQRPGRDLALSRLMEMLLVEALRASQGENASPGLLRGLGDPRVAAAIRRMHAEPERGWTAPDLAAQAAMSRSAFFDRFLRVVGTPPMEYLLTWRMALARDLLGRQGVALSEVAERVGYGSASAFSTAFSRHVGRPPGAYARERRAA